MSKADQRRAEWKRRHDLRRFEAMIGMKIRPMPTRTLRIRCGESEFTVAYSGQACVDLGELGIARFVE